MANVAIKGYGSPSALIPLATMTEPCSPLLPRKQLVELNRMDGFSAGLIQDNDLKRWEIMIIGSADTFYEGGVFKAHLTRSGHLK